MATYYDYSAWNSTTSSAAWSDRYTYIEPIRYEGPVEEYQPINFDFEFPKVKDLQCSEGWDPDEN